VLEEGARDGPPSFPHQFEHQIIADLPRKIGFDTTIMEIIFDVAL
jgi:hypothetical protein